MSENETVEAGSEVVEANVVQSGMNAIIIEGDPSAALARIELIAELAPRWEKALRTILITATFPNDWEQFGGDEDGKMCLGSAGAMRIGKHFPMKWEEVVFIKEEWEATAKIGKGYRYVFSGFGVLGDRRVYAEGSYSSRDNFLGKANQKFKDVSDINEGHIRSAAYHVFNGNIVKELLGLRALPVEEYMELMNKSGQDGSRTTGHNYASGANGGTAKDDVERKKEFANLLIEIANAGYVIVCKDGKDYAIESSDFAMDTPVDTAAMSCEAITTFVAKDKKVVPGLKSARAVKGKRLEIALDRTKKLWAEHNKE